MLIIKFVFIICLIPFIGFSKTLTTKSGKTYYDVEVTSNRCDAENLFIKHKAGVAKIPYSEMSESSQKEYDSILRPYISAKSKQEEAVKTQEREQALKQAKEARELEDRLKVANEKVLQELERDKEPKKNEAQILKTPQKNQQGTAIDMDRVHRIEASLGLTVSEIRSISRELDINAESLQALVLLARETGATTQDMLDALRNLKASKLLVATGDEEKIAAFRTMGISKDDVIRLPLDKLFEQVAKGYVKTSK